MLIISQCTKVWELDSLNLTFDNFQIWKRRKTCWPDRKTGLAHFFWQPEGLAKTDLFDKWTKASNCDDIEMTICYHNPCTTGNFIWTTNQYAKHNKNHSITAWKQITFHPFNSPGVRVINHYYFIDHFQFFSQNDHCALVTYQRFDEWNGTGLI